MTDGLTVSFSDPRTRVVETDDGPWILSALTLDPLERLVQNADSVAAVQDRVGDVAQNATLVHVVTDGAHAETVYAYRSPSATRELYYLVSSAGTAVVTDHFRTALAHLAVEDRTVPRRAVVDHLLFRAPVAPGSYVSAVRSLGQGEWLRWNGDSDEREVTLSDRLRSNEDLRPAQAADAVDEALSDALATADRENTVNLFSGGVDSTLLHTYLGEAIALSGAVDSPEYAYEVEYAEEAAALLGTRHRLVTLDEDDVLEHVEAGIDALGMPSYAFPTILVEAALRHGDSGTYAMAVSADALFGMEGAKSARIASWLAPALSLPGIDWAADYAPRRLRSPFDTLRTLSDQLDRAVTDPRSYPQQVVSYTAPSLVAAFVGEDLVAQRCRRLAEYVRNRVVGAGEGGRFARPVEFAHLVSFYGHRIGSRYRQLAYAHDKSLLTPFDAERVVRCSLSIPAERRYVQGLRDAHRLEPKYILKSLLDRRLPAYETEQEKGAGILPFRRYRTGGALEGVFERYDVPAFVPERVRTRAVEESGRQSWNLLTYAIWRDRVLADPSLEPAPEVRRVEYGF